MPVEYHHVAPSLRRFLEQHPELFMRCDVTGHEDPNGDYWRMQEEIQHIEVTATLRPLR